jgi:preprotein translocase subunit SecG
MGLPLAAVSFTMQIVSVLFVLSAVALGVVILIQKGRGGGLSAAISGGAAGGLFGSKTGDFLTWVTIAMTGLFLFLAVVMGLFYRPIVTQVEDLPPSVTVPAEGPSDRGLGEIPGAPAGDVGAGIGQESPGAPGPAGQ